MTTCATIASQRKESNGLLSTIKATQQYLATRVLPFSSEFSEEYQVSTADFFFLNNLKLSNNEVKIVGMIYSKNFKTLCLVFTCTLNCNARIFGVNGFFPFFFLLLYFWKEIVSRQHFLIDH